MIVRSECICGLQRLLILDGQILHFYQIMLRVLHSRFCFCARIRETLCLLFQIRKGLDGWEAWLCISIDCGISPG